MRESVKTAAFGAAALPPARAFVLFVLVSIRRLRRERIGVPSDRLVEVQA